jgi:hypothetical protein
MVTPPVLAERDTLRRAITAALPRRSSGDGSESEGSPGDIGGAWRWIAGRRYPHRSCRGQTARHQVLENARIMMTAANGIREYTAQHLVPLLPIEQGGKFVPICKLMVQSLNFLS